MKLATPLLVSLLLLGARLAQGESFADETRFTLRQELLRLINNDRKAWGLAPVELDGAASMVADNYCRQQIRHRTTGHFTVDGLSPYMRYSFAGGNDGVSENAAAWTASYAFAERELLAMMRRSEEAMITEVAPRDGHRRTILDPYATHVGVGLAWERGEFRLTEEFIRRYLVWTRPLPRAAAAGEQVVGSARPIGGYKLEAISVHYEPIPQPLARVVANAIETYKLPERRRDYLPRLPTYFRRTGDGGAQLVREEYSDGRRGDFPVAADGSFTFNVPLADGPGVYTVVVWVRKAEERTPIAASNVSIRVDPAAPSFASAAGGTQ